MFFMDSGWIWFILDGWVLMEGKPSWNAPQIFVKFNPAEFCMDTQTNSSIVSGNIHIEKFDAESYGSSSFANIKTPVANTWIKKGTKLATWNKK